MFLFVILNIVVFSVGFSVAAGEDSMNEDCVSNIYPGALDSSECDLSYSEWVSSLDRRIVPQRILDIVGTWNGYPYTTLNKVIQAVSTQNPSYNCYLYALGIVNYNTGINPGFYTGNSWQVGDSELSFKNKLFSDLAYLGYSAQLVSSSYQPQSGEHLICYRFAYSGSTMIDYHFMKYVPSNGEWYHKPGRTSILSYYALHPSSDVWRGEWYSTDCGWNATCTYNSSVYYVVY